MTSRSSATSNPDFKLLFAPLIGYALVAVGLLVWHFHYAFQLISGTDGGVLLDAAWQQYQGAVPYRDFYTAAPPLFLLPAGWAFRIFGPTWESLTVLVCLFSFLTFTWLFFLLWRVTGAGWRALGFALAVQVLTLLPLSWWWYNEITALSGALFFASVCALVTSPADRLARLSFVFAEAMLGLGKVNIAGLLIVLCVLFLFARRPLRFFVILATLAAVALDVGVLALNHISVATLLSNYLQSSSGRMSPRMWISCLTYPPAKQGALALTLVLLLATATGLFVTFARRSEKSALKGSLVLFGIALLTAACGMITNNDSKTLDAVCLVVLLAFSRPQMQGSRFSSVRVAYGGCVLLIASLMLFNLWLGATRLMFNKFGVHSYAQPELRVTLTGPPPLRGMQVNPELAEILQDAAVVLKDQGLPGDRQKKIFCGMNMDVCYAAFGVPVTKQMPLWWEGVPSTFAARDYPTGSDEIVPAFRYRRLAPGQPPDPRVQRFLDTKFDLCLLYVTAAGKPDMTFLPADIRQELYEHYQLTIRGHLAILTRNPSPD